MRNRIREFLGLPAIEDKVQRLREDIHVITLDIPSLAMFKAMEMKQAERHAELLKVLDTQTYRRNIAPAKPSPILDWEAQQAAFLSNPDNFKEEN